MKQFILMFASILLFTNSGFAKNKVAEYFCDLKQNGSEIFLKISEINDENGNNISASAELTIGNGASESIPELKKTSAEVPDFSFRSTVRWTTPRLELTGYLDSSFPGRTFPVDLILPNQPKIQGVCEF